MTRTVLVLLSALCAGTAAAAPPVAVDDAWIAEAPPVAPVQAAYMTLRNSGDRPVRVTGVASPQFGRIEMHRTEMRDGMARMVPVEHLSIEAGQRLVLEPGGLHLMLFEAQGPLRRGDTAALTLTLDDGSEVPVEAEVRPRPAHAPQGHMGH